MNTNGEKRKTAAEIVFLDRNASEKDLHERAFASILRDYADIAAGSLGELLLRANALGFRLHDVTCEGNLKRKGILICRKEGDDSEAVAFIGPAMRLKRGGAFLHVYRFDKLQTEDPELTEATASNRTHPGRGR